jgi:hypothetical protein
LIFSNSRRNFSEFVWRSIAEAQVVAVDVTLLERLQCHSVVLDNSESILDNLDFVPNNYRTQAFYALAGFPFDKIYKGRCRLALAGCARLS